MTPILELRGVSKTYTVRDGAIPAVVGADLTVHEGEFVTIVGPSGCGKSTLLTMVAGLTGTDGGQIRLEGRPVTAPSPRVGLVPQRDNLLPWRTVLGNVEIGLEVQGVPARQRRERARAIVARVGLGDFGDRHPHELSGGMRQRVNIARALVYEPKVVLMDEPFGPLDAMTRGDLQRQLLDLWRNSGMTVLFVTHDLVEAIALSDRVVVMSARPGRILAVVEVGIPRPRDVFQVHRAPGYQEVHAEIWSHLGNQAAVTAS